MKIDPKIFKAYDIRGIYPSEINEKTAYLIARGFCGYLEKYHRISKPKIAVGCDVRNSWKSLKRGLINGLKDGGAEIFDIGFCTTPLNYFANWHLKMDASIMITASHNPKEYNGFKISLKKVKALAEENGIKKLKRIIEKGNFKKKKAGSVKKINVLNDYLKFLAKEADGIDFSDIKIVVDTANGSVGPVFEKLAKKIGLKYYPLYFKPDGNFPNHSPDPLQEKNLIFIKKEIKLKKANLGLAFDGDGDRVFFLSSKSRLIKNDFLLGAMAQYYFKKGKSKFVPADARISKGVREVIEESGGTIIRCKVGYPYVRENMRKYGAFLGGELSGHIFWKDFSYSESALLSVIRVLRILEEFKKPIEEIIKPMERYYSSSEINFQTESKKKKIIQLKNEYQNGKISELDGLTVEFKDWWFNVRPSNTEPLLRLTVEANSQKLLDQKIQEISELIEKSN